MKPPAYRRKHDRLTQGAATKAAIECDMALAPLSRKQGEMELKYGIDRLPGLVNPEMAAKWGRAVASLQEAHEKQDLQEVVKWVGVCIRGLAAMDAEAGADPRNLLPPEIWQVELDGAVYNIIRQPDQWPSWLKDNPGQRVHTLREAAVALASVSTRVTDAVKDAFPGAQIVGVRPMREDMNDDLDGLL